MVVTTPAAVQFRSEVRATPVDLLGGQERGVRTFGFACVPARLPCAAGDVGAAGDWWCY